MKKDGYCGIQIQILVSSVSFSYNYNIQRLVTVFSSLHKINLRCDLPFPTLSLYRQTKKTNRKTDRELLTAVTLAAHAREG